MTGEEVRDIRLRLGVSQERFAAMLGTTVVSVNRWENGKASPSRLYIREIKSLEVQDANKVCRI